MNQFFNGEVELNFNGEVELNLMIHNTNVKMVNMEVYL